MTSGKYVKTFLSDYEYFEYLNSGQKLVISYLKIEVRLAVRMHYYLN